MLIQGNPELGDFADLARQARYIGFEGGADHPTVRLFWGVALSFPLSLQKKLLFFMTGSDRVPILGLSSLRITLQRSAVPTTHLPVAHTCFNQVDLPEYETEDDVRARLLTALEHGSTGFGLA